MATGALLSVASFTPTLEKIVLHDLSISNCTINGQSSALWIR